MIPIAVRTKLTELTILLSVFFTPLLFFLGTKDQFELPKLAFLSLLAALLLLLPPKEHPLPEKNLVLMALSLLFAFQAAASLPWTSLSWRTSLLGDYENFSGLTTSLVYLAWFLCWVRSLTPRTIEKALYFNGLAAFLSSLYAIGQRYGFDFIQWNPLSLNPSREFASLGNPNFLAAYLAMSLPLSIHSFSRTQGTPNDPPPRTGLAIWLLGGIGLLLLLLGTGKGVDFFRLPLATFPFFVSRTLGLLFFSIFLTRVTQAPLLKWVGPAILLVGLLCTGSRGGLLGSAAGLVLYVALLKKKDLSFLGRSLNELRRRARTPGLWVFLVLLALSFWYFFDRRFLRSLLHPFESLEESRLHIWRAGGRMVEAHPLLGTGLDTFKTAFPSYCGVEAGQIDGIFVSSRTAHNELLQAAATTGLPGLLAYLLLLGAFLFIWIKAWRTSPAQGLLSSLAASALAFHVQNLFSFGVASINFLWFFLLASVTVLNGTKKAPGEGTAKSSGVLGLTLTASVAIFLFLFPIRRMAADAAFGTALAATQTLHRSQLREDLDRTKISDYGIAQNKRAVVLMPLEVKYWLYLGEAYEQRASMKGAEARTWVQKAGVCYEKALAMSPSNAYYHNNLGRVYSGLAKWDPSYRDMTEKAYERATQLAPTGPLFMVQWALALEMNGKGKEAQAAFAKAMGLDQDFTAKVLAQTAVTEYDAGEKAKAFGHLSLAIEGNPEGPEAYYVRGRLNLYDGKKKAASLDFLKTKTLGPTPDKNPAVKDLDRYLAEAEKP